MLKYYLYVSDKKVDMLLPQIPDKIKHKLSAEIGVNIGVLTAKLQSERIAYEDRIHRLLAVDRYIQGDAVGGLDDFKPWIRDSMDAYLSRFDENKNLVFFIGNSRQSDLVLGGSSAHLIAHDPSHDVSAGWSYMPDLLETLENVVNRGYDLLLPESDMVGYLSNGVGSPGVPSPWYNVIEVVQGRVSGPSVRIEFLAKRLAVGEPSLRTGRRPILASPVFVAMD